MSYSHPMSLWHIHYDIIPCGIIPCGNMAGGNLLGNHHHNHHRNDHPHRHHHHHHHRNDVPNMPLGEADQAPISLQMFTPGASYLLSSIQVIINSSSLTSSLSYSRLNSSIQGIIITIFIIIATKCTDHQMVSPVVRTSSSSSS